MFLFTIKIYKLTLGTYIYAKLYFSNQKGSTQLKTLFKAYTFLVRLLLYQLYAGINFYLHDISFIHLQLLFWDEFN